MLGMGLSLTPRDFRRIAEAPTATILGTILQLVVIPATGVGIAIGFDLPPLLAAGLVLLAASPGGMFSNVFVHLARGNTALSITLTTAATMVTLLTIPAFLNAAVVMGLVPTKGLTLPFLSYGRTSLVVSCVALGILLGVARRHPAGKKAEVKWQGAG